MEILLGIIQFVLIILICIVEFNKRSPAVFMWATLWVMFGVMHLLTVFNTGYKYTDQVLNEASIFVIGFCIIYLITRGVLLNGKFFVRYMPLRRDYADSLKVSKDITNMIIYLYLFVALLKIALYMDSMGSLSDTSWLSWYEYNQNSSLVGSVGIKFVVTALIGITFYLLLRKEYKTAMLILAIQGTSSIIFRERSELLLVFIVLLSVVIFNIKKLNVRTIIAVVLIAFFMIYAIYALRTFRYYGTVDNFISSFELNDFINRTNEFILTDNGELGLRQYWYYFIEKDNNFDQFGQLSTYIRMVLFFLPTKLSLGLKPDDFAIAMGAAVGMQSGGSMHPTLFGDCYANAGMMGIFLGIFWAGLVTLIDKIMLKFKGGICLYLCYITCGYAYVLIARGSVYNGWLYMAYGIVILWVLDFCIRRIRILFGKRKFKIKW